MIASEPPTQRRAGGTPEENDQDPLEALLTRERARHHCELVQTREQITELLASPAASLLAALDDDLAAVAIATVEAMSALRRTQVEGRSEPGPTTDSVTHAIGKYLTQVARLTRSTLAIHLTLEAQARST